MPLLISASQLSWGWKGMSQNPSLCSRHNWLLELPTPRWKGFLLSKVVSWSLFRHAVQAAPEVVILYLEAPRKYVNTLEVLGLCEGVLAVSVLPVLCGSAATRFGHTTFATSLVKGMLIWHIQRPTIELTRKCPLGTREPIS